VRSTIGFSRGKREILSYEHQSASVGTNDPGSWNAASYVDDPISHIEPLESVTSEYRECALQLLDVLRAVDEFMFVCRSGRPPRKWLAVSLALGLASTRGKTETALEWGVPRASISKDVVAVLRLAHLEDNSAWGLKSAENRETYAVAGLTL
jgi:hypothetical protein